MNECKHRSLTWIHRVRKENYYKTREKSLQDIIYESVKRTKENISNYRS